MSIPLDLIPRKNIPLLLKTLPIEKIVQLCETCSEFEPYVEFNRKDIKLETKAELSVIQRPEEKIQYQHLLECNLNDIHNPAHVHFECIGIWSNLSCSDPTKTDCLDHRSRCLRQAQKTLKLSCNRLKLACSLTSSFLFTAIPCKYLHIYDLLDHSTLRWIPNTVSTIRINRAPDEPVPLSHLVRFEEIIIGGHQTYRHVPDVDYYIQFFSNYHGQLKKLHLLHNYTPLTVPNLVKLHEGKRFMEPCNFILSLLDILDGELLLIRQEKKTIAFSVYGTMEEVAKEVICQLMIGHREVHGSYVSHSPLEKRWMKDRMKKKSNFRFPTSVLLERLIAARREDYAGIIKDYVEDKVTRNGISLKHVVQPRQKRMPELIDTSVMLESRMRTKRKSSKHDDYNYGK